MYSAMRPHVFPSSKNPRGDDLLTSPNTGSNRGRKNPNLELQDSNSFSLRSQPRFALVLHMQDTLKWNTAG